VVLLYSVCVSLFQFEKEKVDKMVKRLESEKDTINTDLIHIRVTNSKVQLEYEKMVDDKNKLMQQLEDLKEDKERVSDSKSSVSIQLWTFHQF
jgi:predicted nuclease with TOPRIM domain